MKHGRPTHLTGSSILLFLAFAAFAGCGDDGGEQAAEAGRGLTGVVVAVGKSPTTLDPVKIIDVDSLAVALAVHAPLAVVDPKGLILPVLAQSIDLQDDAMSVRISLREAACWDGSALTADDVVSSFERFRGSGHPHRWILDSIMGVDEFDAKETDHIDGIRPLDPRTVEIDFKYPDADFVKFISSSALLITKSGSPDVSLVYDTQVVGCGPYMPDRIDPGSQIELRRNNGFPIPSALHSLTFQIIANPQQRMRKLELGDVHLLRLQGPMLDEALELEDGARLMPRKELATTAIVQSEANEMSFLKVNWSSSAFNQMPVSERKLWVDTFSETLDRTTLLENLYLGQGQPAFGVVPPSLVNASRSTSSSATNDVRTLRLICPNDPESRRLGQYVKSRAEAKGIKIQLEFADLNRLVGRVLSGDYDMALLWVENQIPAGVAGWLAFFSEENPLSALGEPVPNVGQRVHETRKLANGSGRDQAYSELVRDIGLTQTSWIPIVSRNTVYLVDDRLEGVFLDANGLLYFAFLSSRP